MRLLHQIQDNLTLYMRASPLAPSRQLSAVFYLTVGYLTLRLLSALRNLSLFPFKNLQKQSSETSCLRFLLGAAIRRQRLADEAVEGLLWVIEMPIAPLGDVVFNYPACSLTRSWSVIHTNVEFT